MTTPSIIRSVTIEAVELVNSDRKVVQVAGRFSDTVATQEPDTIQWAGMLINPGTYVHRDDVLAMLRDAMDKDGYGVEADLMALTAVEDVIRRLEA